MTQRQKWAEHKFNLNIDSGWSRNIITRLESTLILLKYNTKGVSEDHLSSNYEGKWSIKKHIGHLIDLEALWIDRFEQFNQKVSELVAADMSNKKTKDTDYNTKEIETLLENFKNSRRMLITKFRELDPSSLSHKAYHRRLGVHMKPVDLLFFIAEHDDHHLTTINEIKNKQVIH